MRDALGYIRDHLRRASLCKNQSSGPAADFWGRRDITIPFSIKLEKVLPFQEHKEVLIGHVGVVGNPCIFFGKIMRELSFEVNAARGQNYLVTVNWFSFNHQSNI